MYTSLYRLRVYHQLPQLLGSELFTSRKNMLPCIAG